MKKTFNSLVGKRKLVISLDLSTYCNAACPQCHRTDPNGLGKVDWLPLIKWSLEDFKRQFPQNSMNSIKSFNICGTWGDPMMSKDIGKICKYIIDNSEADIQINTNGGMRTPVFYEDLGNYCKERLIVYFDVDGTTDEMHQKYRRGVDLQTVLDNMEALSSTPASTRAFVILFKHNENYVYDIKDMCRMYGAEHIHVIKSDRFLVNNKFEFINENGDTEVLEEITKNLNHIIENPWIDNASDNLLEEIGKTDKTVMTSYVGNNDR
jgi:molybdenum cofactor biosynthesis enzyme MoaA